MPEKKSEIELRLKATGGKQAAKEVGEVTESVEELAQAEREAGGENGASDIFAETQDRLSEKVSETRKRLEEKRKSLEATSESTQKVNRTVGETFPTFTKWGNSITGVGASLVSMAGGPLTIAVAGLGLVIKAISTLQTKIENSRDAAARAIPDIVSATADAAVEAESLATAEAAATTAIGQIDRAVGGYISKLERATTLQSQLIEAGLDEELAGIELEEARGDMTPGQARDAAFEAKRKAAIAVREGERKLIEDEIRTLEAAAAAARDDLLAATSPARDAQAELDATLRQKASGAPELRGLREARNNAGLALSQAERDDPEKIAALEKVFQDAQQELVDAYDKLVTGRIEARNKELKKFSDAKNRSVDATGNLDEARRRLSEFDSSGQSIFDSQQEAAALRFDAETERQNRAEKEREDARRRKEEDDRKKEEAQRAADAEAQRLAGEVNTILGQAHDRDNPAVQALEKIHSQLMDGTNEREVIAVQAKTNEIVRDLAAVNSRMTSEVRRLAADLERLRSQLAASRTQ